MNSIVTSLAGSCESVYKSDVSVTEPVEFLWSNKSSKIKIIYWSTGWPLL